MPTILLQRWLLNLLLAAVAGLLALLAVAEHEREARSARLTALEPEAITRIELARRGEPAIEFVREQDRWQMRAPFVGPAEADEIARLLPIAAADSLRTLPAAAAELDRLGLAEPRIRLVLDGLVLRVGATEPVAELRYVQVGDLVHLIDDRFLPRLMKPALELLSRRLLPPDFSPDRGRIDGRPLSAAALADLVGVEAERIEPLGDALSGHLLEIESADGGRTLRFLVADGGARWSRLDRRLSWVFTTPPLMEADEDVGFEGAQDATTLPSAAASPPPAAEDGVR